MRLSSLVFLALLFWISDLHAKQNFTRTQLLMGNVQTSLTIEARASERDKAFEAMESAFDEARRIEEAVSEWRPESQTSRINRSESNHWISVGLDLLKILIKAESISKETDGAFDVTFSSKNPKASFRDIEIDKENSRVRLKRRGIKIGISGIAKGYIVDQMSRILREHGFRKYLVNAGDLYASGSWKIGIRDPSGDESQIIKTIRVKDRAVSTSGTYERGPHIMNPRTRQPISRSGSITVIAPTSMEADAWATALFVLGEEKGREILKRHPEFRAVFY